MRPTLHVLLIRPSKYDDEGYIVRFWRGVLPSNTLATMAGLTRGAIDSGTLGDARVEVSTLDEQVDRIDPERLVKRLSRRGGARVLVGLCGVQSNQFARAADMALTFREAGAMVMIGGFHVSGVLATSRAGPDAPLRRLMHAGVTLVRGEVDRCWERLLRDALADRLQPLYEISPAPELEGAPLPSLDQGSLRGFVSKHSATIDTSRGCPFSCSFCTIINVQGRRMRARTPADVVDFVRRSVRQKVEYFFFTDDNFSRNPHWEEILDGLIALRLDEGRTITFMMQVDVLAARQPRFVEKAAAAGCTQVFVGMESLNPANLTSAHKGQNHVDEYADIVAAWHAHDVAFHVGYIIGFENDTLESVRKDVSRLSGEIGVDQASFFVLTPLPGSEDHARLVESGTPIDQDLNRFDSAHPTVGHPRMSAAQWDEAYEEAWSTFYSIDSMKRILARANPRTYWGLFRNFLWYRYAIFVEGIHPMLAGLVRLRDRRQRRPGFAVEGRWRHALRRTREFSHLASGVAHLFIDLQEVWLATRDSARPHRGRRRHPAHLIADTRADLDAYWKRTLAALRTGRPWRVNPLRFALNGARDACRSTAFTLSMLAALVRSG